MNCRRVQGQLSAYVDSELTGYDMLNIREHLSRCRECSEERDAVLSIKNLLLNLPDREPDTMWLDRMREEVRYASLPPQARFQMALASLNTVSFVGNRRLASTAMLSILSVFLLSGSFNHTVRTAANALDSRFRTASNDHIGRAVSYGPVGPAILSDAALQSAERTPDVRLVTSQSSFPRYRPYFSEPRGMETSMTMVSLSSSYSGR